MIREPRARSTDQRFYGIAEGIVTDVNDPDREGRVKVRFPWFDDETVSEWCRVRQLYAGPGYGTFFVPEVGDEVLVAFIHGDMRLPIILGGLFNGQDKPPSYRADDRDQKLIRTKAGHEVLLDDSSGEERIRLTTQGGHEIDMTDDEKRVSVTSDGGHELVLDDRGRSVDLATTAGHQVILDDASSTVTVRTASGQSIVLNGLTGTVTITGATVNIDSSAITFGGSAAIEPLVLGASFMALFNSHVHVLGAATTGPPATPMTQAQLSKRSKTI